MQRKYKFGLAAVLLLVVGYVLFGGQSKFFKGSFLALPTGSAECQDAKILRACPGADYACVSTLKTTLFQSTIPDLEGQIVNLSADVIKKQAAYNNAQKAYQAQATTVKSLQLSVDKAKAKLDAAQKELAAAKAASAISTVKPTVKPKPGTAISVIPNLKIVAAEKKVKDAQLAYDNVSSQYASEVVLLKQLDSQMQAANTALVASQQALATTTTTLNDAKTQLQKANACLGTAVDVHDFAITYPAGAENIYGSSTVVVRWTTGLPSGRTVNIKMVALSQPSYGETPLIYPPTLNDGEEAVTLLNFPSAQYKIKIECANCSAPADHAYSASFNLVHVEPLSVTSPVYAAALAGGSTVNVKWRGLTQSHKIRISINQSGATTVLADGVTNSGNADVILPNPTVIDASAKLIVEGVDADGSISMWNKVQIPVTLTRPVTASTLIANTQYSRGEFYSHDGYQRVLEFNLVASNDEEIEIPSLTFTLDGTDGGVSTRLNENIGIKFVPEGSADPYLQVGTTYYNNAREYNYSTGNSEFTLVLRQTYNWPPVLARGTNTKVILFVDGAGNLAQPGRTLAFGLKSISAVGSITHQPIAVSIVNPTQTGFNEMIVKATPGTPLAIGPTSIGIREMDMDDESFSQGEYGSSLVNGQNNLYAFSVRSGYRVGLKNVTFELNGTPGLELTGLELYRNGMLVAPVNGSSTINYNSGQPVFTSNTRTHTASIQWSYSGDDMTNCNDSVRRCASTYMLKASVSGADAGATLSARILGDASQSTRPYSRDARCEEIGQFVWVDTPFNMCINGAVAPDQRVSGLPTTVHTLSF